MKVLDWKKSQKGSIEFCVITREILLGKIKKVKRIKDNFFFKLDDLVYVENHASKYVYINKFEEDNIHVLVGLKNGLVFDFNPETGKLESKVQELNESYWSRININSINTATVPIELIE